MREEGCEAPGGAVAPKYQRPGRAAPLGRPRAFDEETVLAAIMAVFWTKGFEGASTADLVAATGVKKGSLYAAFGDKRAMYRKALAFYDRTRIDRAARALAADGDPRARIARFLEAACGDGRETATGGEVADPLGCFTCNASIDQAQSDPETSKLVQASLARLERALTAAIAEAGGAGAAQDAKRQVCHLIAVYFGLRVLAKAGAARAVLEQAKTVALDVLPEPGSSR